MEPFVFGHSQVDQCDKVIDSLEVANANLRADLDRWHVVKKVDMKQMIDTMAAAHILYYDQVGVVNRFS